MEAFYENCITNIENRDTSNFTDIQKECVSTATKCIKDDEFRDFMLNKNDCTSIKGENEFLENYTELEDEYKYVIWFNMKIMLTMSICCGHDIPKSLIKFIELANKYPQEIQNLLQLQNVDNMEDFDPVLKEKSFKFGMEYTKFMCKKTLGDGFTEEEKERLVENDMRGIHEKFERLDDFMKENPKPTLDQIKEVMDN